MKKHSKMWLPLVVGMLLLGMSVSAQVRESGSIIGNVTDEQGVPLPGATVTVESPGLIGGAKSTTADNKGFYRFWSLSVGTYKIAVTLQGFNTMVKEGVDLHARMTLSADFKMTQAKEAVEVIVTGDIPTLDTKSSQPRPIIMTDNFLTSLPGKPGWSGLMDLAPGAVGNDFLGSGYMHTAWHADGVDVQDAFFGGSGYVADIRTIKEASVQGLGLPAEYGHFTGAVLSTVSKSGSNRFSTFNEFQYQGKEWNSQNRQQIPVDQWLLPEYGDVKYMTNPFYDISSQFGGRIIRDRLWFFVSGEYSKTQVPILGLDKSQDTTSLKSFSKLTFQLNPSQRFNVAMNVYQNKTTNGDVSVINPVIGYNYDEPGFNVNLNWTSIWSPTTFFDLKLGYNYYNFEMNPNQGMDIIGGYDYWTWTYIGNAPYYQAESSTNYHASAHFSHFIPQFLAGSHDFKAGLEFVKYKMLWDRGAPGNRIENYWMGEPYTAEDRPRWIHDTYSDNGVGFIQDQWSPNKRLTLNLGARFDYFSYYFPKGTSPLGTIYHNLQVSPRLGVTYDLLGDRKNIIKLNYSHYADKMMRGWGLNNFEHRYEGGAKYTWDGTQWVQYGIPWGPYPAPTYKVEKDLSQPYIREISGGYERELFRDATLSLTFWLRSTGAFMDLLNFATVYEPYTIINPGPDGLEGTADDKGTMTAYSPVNPYERDRRIANPKKGHPAWLTEDPKWYSRGAELRFTKRFSNRWQMMASYMYLRVRGNVEAGTDFTYYDPNRGINSYGDCGIWQPHQFRLQGNVLLPLDISFSGILNIFSGPNMTPLFTPSFIPGITWTEIKAEAPGKTKGKAMSNLDLKVEKIFRYRGFSLGLTLDIFNALNNYDDLGIETYYGPYFGKRYDYAKTPRSFIVGLRIIY